MRRFRYRNLLIQVLPESGQHLRESCPWDSCAITGCLGCTGAITVLCGASVCGGCTLQITENPCDGNCSQQPSGACLPCTNITDVRRFGRLEIEDLAILKERLKDALAEVEAHEQAINGLLQPRDLSEAEELEAQLREALEHLQAQKERLSRVRDESRDEQDT